MTVAMALSEFNTNSVMRSPHQWRYLGAVSLYLGGHKAECFKGPKVRYHRALGNMAFTQN